MNESTTREDKLADIIVIIGGSLLVGFIFLVMFSSPLCRLFVSMGIEPAAASVLSSAVCFVIGSMLTYLLVDRLAHPKLTQEQIEAKAEMHAAIASIEAISIIHEEYEERLRRLRQAQRALADAFDADWRYFGKCHLNLIPGLVQEFGSYCETIFEEPYQPFSE
ncbi:MAG: hypothetical protein COU32_04200 [Candidatus Magasanikbacteria bacterium CG10_big_fil_rev_8_21_14_0_10_42_10]|uniref:Uncharacterized protein n=2 Tax=Candidatus Magasanikiibacteriota TaxID=1752731 RepID=A0A2H0TV69_9BACT|nr:MAG: hypothetical protein COU32_04200 [Candidatus Magasanikbacteria bacterium CG10_big_fil_rev_8_21_14_0_10_42_10]PIZ93665.1 MAG: hypothetical protein COX82_02230 [Candidatus Magasanikbacteria bacterium CG_4_10_14_0_2_um_filter_41_10]